ncbi:MAG: hypothetical protein DRZ82_05440 [Thermoprotei archaeon]|nr:MAG: hypothetical protein DRZ82_05440 [Thermoprotei archaeon]
MHLTKEEERILDGEKGEALSVAMKILVGLGEIHDAERLIPISSAHVSGISYGNIGEEGLNFIRFLCNGNHFVVSTTVNPTAMDLESWQEMKIPKDYAEKQLEIAECLIRAGAIVSFTCTPYLGYTFPQYGDHVAWGESSAVAFINSVLGARTNKEGGPSALASALLGKTPLYGLHIKDNRRPTVRVIVRFNLQTITDFSILGYAIGHRIRSGIPLIENIKVYTNDYDKLKAFSAGIAAPSNIAMYLIKGISPDAISISEHDLRNLEKVEITIDDVNEELSSLSSPLERPDLVFFGCPHYSLRELERVIGYIKAHGIVNRTDVPIWIAVSRATYKRAVELGYVSFLKRRGIKVIRDTCAVVMPLKLMGIKSVATDSAKAAHYIRLRHGATVYLADALKILESILT